VQLWKSLRNRAAKKTAWTLILQQIGDTGAQGRYSETGGGGSLGCFQVELVSHEGIERAQFDGLAVATDTI
jgi:hypothetical protein